MTIDVCWDFILFFCAVAFPTVKDCPAIALQCLHVLIHDLSICVHVGLGNISFTVSDGVSWQCSLWQTACSTKFLALICLFSLSMSYLDCVDPLMFPFFGSIWGLDFLELMFNEGIGNCLDTLWGRLSCFLSPDGSFCLPEKMRTLYNKASKCSSDR
jgi:hypothetical protein